MAGKKKGLFHLVITALLLIILIFQSVFAEGAGAVSPDDAANGSEEISSGANENARESTEQPPANPDNPENIPEVGDPENAPGTENDAGAESDLGSENASGAEEISGNETPQEPLFGNPPVFGAPQTRGGIAINSTNFPDDAFRTFVKGYDTDNNGSLSQAELDAVNSSMNIYNKGIADLTGIQHFTKLKILIAGRNNLTNPDFSGMTALTDIRLPNNKLVSITVPPNVKRISLENNASYGQNSVKNIYSSVPVNLDYLNLNKNSLSDADFSAILQNVTGVTTLRLDFNNLQNTNFNAISGLKDLECRSNQISQFGTTNFPTTLTKLVIENNNLTNLSEISSFTNLKHLSVSNNKLGTLDVRALNSLEHLNCQKCELTDLQVAGLSNLKYLAYSRNQLSDVDTTGLTALDKYHCGENPITSLDLSKTPNISWLTCPWCRLSALDITMLGKLKQIDFAYNRIPHIDLKGQLPNPSLLTNVLCVNQTLGRYEATFVDGHYELDLEATFPGLDKTRVLSGGTYRQSGSNKL